MNTVANGKGDRPRNNWGRSWYSRYDSIDWDKESGRRSPVENGTLQNKQAAGGEEPAPEHNSGANGRA